MHSNYGPHSLREAFDMTLEFEKEYQITQLQSTFTVIEMFYEETPEQEEFPMEEVQMRLQIKVKVNINKVTTLTIRRGNTTMVAKSLIKGTITETTLTKATNHSISRDQSKIKAIIPRILKDFKVKVKVK